ncbi:unnamed protein product [Adineta ricciae]|uniref:Uncharacterized protein n=1 Tax=Adineta ricciae TaxID=249248 RepID=A0A815MBA3_ADIRI|nr:unnamed protein product [Adineta ricciae]CAF1422197.1 unnamed protein product [Adineta ricciae]
MKSNLTSTVFSFDTKLNDGTNRRILLSSTYVEGSTESDYESIETISPGHPRPYLYSYDDPVYIFAGKFSANGFFIKFSQWSGEPNGPGYHSFKNPNSLQSRYFNLYNTISEKLSDFISDQERVVFVSSITTDFRVYKSNGTYRNLTGYSNYGALYFGYDNDQEGSRRGPGSKNFIVSSTSEMTLYGMGALRNNFIDSV